MGKKIIVKSVQPKRVSSRPIKKRKPRPDEEEFYQDQESARQQQSKENQKNSDQPASEQSGEDGQQGSDDEEDSEQSSISELKAQNMAIRHMQFRQRRGTKMNYLINRKKQQEEDPFWAEQGQNYFGNLDDGDNDQEDYEQSSSGRDEFDSDFNQTESEHDEEQPQDQKQVDEDMEKQKKKRQQLMRKLQAPAPSVKKVAPKTSTPTTAKKVEKIQSQKKISPQASSRYIHQVFKQQQLLGEAATTQYFNWLSLKKLISIETEKKDFTARSHHIEGPRIIYRDRYNPEGTREVSYQLQDITLTGIKDLTQLLNQH